MRTGNGRKLLIVEDEISLAKQLRWALDKDYEIKIASNGDEARSLLSKALFPIVTLDLGLPPQPDTAEEGFKLLKDIRTLSPNSKVIVITGSTLEETAVKAIAMGAVDFCSKPIDLKILEIILSRWARIHDLEEANRALQQQSGRACSLCDMLGTSPAMTRLFELIRNVSATDYPVLICGESGTGKEMTARSIHALSRRAGKSLIVINCGAIPETLLESELFGHEKGAFTGAAGRKIGRFELADKGTLFLDEIAELSPPLQVKLLRFLQEGTIERLGGTATMKLDVRVIAATNADIEQATRDGRFREDLFYRINVVPLTVPPLRERPEDILVLAQHILRDESRTLGKPSLSFSPGALAAMAAHSWPGNVRELQNAIRRGITLADRVINTSDLGLEAVFVDETELQIHTLQQARDKAEIQVIRKALALTGNNISQAARILEISRPTLHDLLKKHAIQHQ